jgi:hypothetical protein
MPDESLLRDKARECVEQRKLPNRKPDRMWGGKGLGDSSCVVCNLIVSRDEVALEYRVRCDRPNAAYRIPSCPRALFRGLGVGAHKSRRPSSDLALKCSWCTSCEQSGRSRPGVGSS